MISKTIIYKKFFEKTWYLPTNGKINYYVGPLKQTDQVKIVLYDQDYQEISRQIVPMSVE